METQGRWLAVDIGGTMIKYGLFDDGGRLLAQNATRTLAHEGGEALMTRVEALCAEHGRVRGVGVCTSGQVNPVTGSVTFATCAIPGWEGMPVGARLSARCGAPATVENDANAAALGEARFGSGRGESNLLCLTYGTGIGGGLVLDGRLYRGAGFSAGECGHLVIVAGGRSCACGGNGCYEAYASAGALFRDAAQELRTEIDPRAFFRAVEAGAEAERRVYARWLDYVLAGLAGLTHVLNPGRIVLGGGVMQQPFIARDVAERLPCRVMRSFAGVGVAAAALGNLAGLYGAYCLAREAAGEEG